MCENKILRDIFGKKWKDKYVIDWCHLCDCVIIICPSCNLSSCSGGGCEECIKDYNEWSTIKHDIKSYLTPEEYSSYKKGLRLRDLIIKSIEERESQINWKVLKENGELSGYDEITFFNLI